MNFTTQINLSKSNNPIDYSSKMISLGSCFAENMAEKFEYFKFSNTTNPFGIIFNPVSIEKIISRVINQEFFTEKDIFFQNECWHCFEVHSELSHNGKKEFLEQLNSILKTTHKQINEATHVIITLGTSWVYRNIETNAIVANCHKVLQKQFTKELLSVETIRQSLKNIIALVTTINTNVKFIFTVSPVRHIKDGFIENNVSKANLITAIYQCLQTEHYKPSTEYFPSYEIMMDELRDYRFYAQDMLHPNQVAIDYIWIKFFENYIVEREFKTMQEVCDIQKALHHKPFNPDSESHQKFLKNVNEKINILASKYPQTNFDFYQEKQKD
jgi:lysophospholipase L1-like esterase